MEPNLESDNLYEILGVPSDAPADKIRKAYLKLAARNHPDKNTGEEEKYSVIFQKISKAYQVLSDPEQRSFYDENGETEEDMQNKDPDEMLAAFLKMYTKTKRLDEQDIASYFKDQERERQEAGTLVSAVEDEDIRKYFPRVKGDMKKMVQCVIGCESHDLPRFCKHIDNLIAQGVLESTKAYEKTRVVEPLKEEELMQDDEEGHSLGEEEEEADEDEAEKKPKKKAAAKKSAAGPSSASNTKKRSKPSASSSSAPEEAAAAKPSKKKTGKKSKEAEDNGADESGQVEDMGSLAAMMRDAAAKRAAKGRW